MTHRDPRAPAGPRSLRALPILAIGCAALFASVSYLSWAHASWSDAPELEVLACRADVIVWGRVESVTVEPGSRHGLRVSRITPTRVLKGSPGAEILEQSSAALHGGHTQYQEGEEVVAFLAAVKAPSRYHTVQDSQGVLRVTDGIVGRVELPVEDVVARLVRAVEACADAS